MQNLTRRAVLAGAAALAPAVAAGAVPLDADTTGPLCGDDAYLMALWNRRERLRKSSEAVGAEEPQDGLDTLHYRAWERRQRTATRLLMNVEREIAETPAQTVAGLAVKARIAAEVVPSFDDPDPYELCFQTLVADLERLATTH